MDSDVVALAAIFFIFGAPVAGWIISRVLRHNERMAMIRAGMVPPAGNWGKNWQQANWPPGTAQQGQPQPAAPPKGSSANAYMFPGDYAQQQLAKGIRITLVGVALLVGLSFIGHGYFGVWMLGGLIPMFVGIAQMITALMAGARFAPYDRMGPGPAQAQPGFYADPPRPAPPAGAPYGWRPGPTPEIEKPAGPPDIRQ